MDLTIKKIVTGKEIAFPKIQQPLPELNFVLNIVGCMKAGKSNTISNIISRFYKNIFTNVFFVSPTFKNDPAFSILDISPEKIFSDFNDKVFEQITSTIKEDLVQDPKSLHLIVFDDCGGNNNVYNSNFTGKLANLVFLHRHLNTSIIFSVQNYISLPAKLREVVSYFLIYKIGTNKELTKITDENAITVSKDKFKSFLNYATKDPYNFLYINKPNGSYYKNFTERLE